MTLHDPRPPQWPPATATFAYLAAYERTGPTTPGADQQVWDQVTDHGWAWAEDSDALWEVVRCWPGLSGGAIPVVTGR